MTTTDHIEKSIVLKAPVSRVWQALTTPAEFGTWFRAKLTGEFRPGATVHAKVTYPGYEHVSFEMTIEAMEAERLFSYRWHPNAVDPEKDYSSEPTTLVEFRLEPVAEGTSLTLVESGFAGIPEARRDEAFRMNSEGWAWQLANVRSHVEG